MSYAQFSNTIGYLNEFLRKNNIEDCVFIKDIKLGTHEYHGSNVDLLCLSDKSYKKIYAFLQSKGFKKEKISFEFDKSMFFPPKGDAELTKVHLYPYLGWYTVRVHFWQGNFLQHTTINENDVRVPAPALEVPLILFHAYFEDRLLRDYDIRHISTILERHKLKNSDFDRTVSEHYNKLFYRLLDDFRARKANQSEGLKYDDFAEQIGFVLKTQNRAARKLYYLMIHIAKKAKIIRG